MANETDDTVYKPDQALEIPSPTTARRDRAIQFELCRLAGVREYWIDVKALFPPIRKATYCDRTSSVVY